MIPSPHTLLCLLVPFLLVVQAPPPPRPAPVPAERAFSTHYEHLYHSLTQPLALYHVDPPIYAPVSPPRGTARLSPALHNYPRLVNSHEAYIGPRAGDTISAVLARMRRMTATQLGRSEQRSLLALLEELSSSSRREIRAPLHPENVAAQHRAPLARLHATLADLLALIDEPGEVERWTHRLSADENERWLDARETLQAEKELLGVAAERYAGRFPG